MAAVPQPISINETISLYPPSSEPSPASFSSPTLIILTTWIDAPQKAIAKFVTGYQTLFPGARLYVVRVLRIEYVWTSYDAVRPSLLPLVEVLKKTKPEHVLLATYSNGGLMKTSLLAEAYLSATGKPLSPHRIIMDSCPDKEYIKRIVHATQFGFPRLFILYYPLLAFTYGIMYARTAYMWASGSENVLERSARIANDDRFLKQDMPRCYIFSKADKTIDWRDLLQHAHSARETGGDVRIEEFVGSDHVEHMRIDSERYWKIVKSFWETSRDNPIASKL